MNSAEKKGFDLSLRFVSLFAAAHVVLVLLQTNFVPLSGGWNVVWLGLELLLGGAPATPSRPTRSFSKSPSTSAASKWSAASPKPSSPSS